MNIYVSFIVVVLSGNLTAVVSVLNTIIIPELWMTIKAVCLKVVLNSTVLWLLNFQANT